MTAFDLREPFAVLFIVLASALAAPSAHAQWSVQDDKAITELQNINKHLDIAIPPTTITDSALSDKPPDPMTSPWPALDNVYQSCNGMMAAQNAICSQIADARSAYYTYMQNMYANNLKRYDLLKNLITRRNHLSQKYQFGEMQALTNEIQTLQTLITLDRQQTETVAHGYQMRIQYLNAQMTQQAKDTLSGASNGDPSTVIGNLLNAAVGTTVLKAALTNVKNTPQSGQLTLTVDK
jgi:hypothetical protein